MILRAGERDFARVALTGAAADAVAIIVTGNSSAASIVSSPPLSRITDAVPCLE